MLSGMKPPSIRPRRALHAQNEERPERKACILATRLQDTICIGIQLSAGTCVSMIGDKRTPQDYSPGPIFLEISCDGISANRNVR